MARLAPPLSLAQKVTGAAEAVRTLTAKRDRIAHVELPEALDRLANLESQVLGKAPGWEDATLSGLILDNPYCTKPQAPAEDPQRAPTPEDEKPAVPRRGKKE